MFANSDKLKRYIIVCEIGFRNAKNDKARMAFAECLEVLNAYLLFGF